MLMYSLSAQDADLALCRCEDGVETALQYTKIWCRYAKDILSWMEKRIGLGKCLNIYIHCNQKHDEGARLSLLRCPAQVSVVS